MLEDDLIPKPEFDEFGDQIVRPVVSSNDGFEMIVDNFDAWATYTKEARHPDAGRGDISQAELRRKKGMLQSMEKVRIVGIGDRNYEDID